MNLFRASVLLVVGSMTHGVREGEAVGCDPLSRSGVFIDWIRATSDLSRLSATLNLYDDNGQLTETKQATIHLDSGTVVEGFDAPEGTEIFPAGLGTPLDFSKYKYVLDVDPNNQEFIGSVVNSETDDKVSFALPDLKPNEFGQEVVLWFVSEQLQRTYVFYEYIFFNEEVVERFDKRPPQVVVVIAPMPGTEGKVTYLAYENFLDTISFGEGGENFDGRMTVYENIRLSVVPQNTCTATTMYYKDDGVELRNLGLGPFDVGGTAVSSEPTADYVLKADHVIAMGRPNAYVIYKTNIWNGERTQFPLNADQVLGMFGATAVPQGATGTLATSLAHSPRHSIATTVIAAVSLLSYTALGSND